MAAAKAVLVFVACLGLALPRGRAHELDLHAEAAAARVAATIDERLRKVDATLDEVTLAIEKSREKEDRVGVLGGNKASFSSLINESSIVIVRAIPVDGDVPEEVPVLRQAPPIDIMDMEGAEGEPSGRIMPPINVSSFAKAALKSLQPTMDDFMALKAMVMQNRKMLDSLEAQAQGQSMEAHLAQMRRWQQAHDEAKAQIEKEQDTMAVFMKAAKAKKELEAMIGEMSAMAQHQKQMMQLEKMKDTNRYLKQAYHAAQLAQAHSQAHKVVLPQHMEERLAAHLDQARDLVGDEAAATAANNLVRKQMQIAHWLAGQRSLNSSSLISKSSMAFKAKKMNMTDVAAMQKDYKELQVEMAHLRDENIMLKSKLEEIAEISEEAESGMDASPQMREIAHISMDQAQAVKKAAAKIEQQRLKNETVVVPEIHFGHKRTAEERKAREEELKKKKEAPAAAIPEDEDKGKLEKKYASLAKKNDVDAKDPTPSNVLGTMASMNRSMPVSATQSAPAFPASGNATNYFLKEEEAEENAPLDEDEWDDDDNATAAKPKVQVHNETWLSKRLEALKEKAEEATDDMDYLRRKMKVEDRTSLQEIAAARKVLDEGRASAAAEPAAKEKAEVQKEVAGLNTEELGVLKNLLTKLQAKEEPQPPAAAAPKPDAVTESLEMVKQSKAASSTSKAATKAAVTAELRREHQELVDMKHEELSFWKHNAGIVIGIAFGLMGVIGVVWSIFTCFSRAREGPHGKATRRRGQKKSFLFNN